MNKPLPSAAKAYPGTQAVLRALRMLKLFHAQPTLSLADVRERTGLNRSTAFRILTALEAEGMLERLDRDAYRLGPQIAALGRRASGAGDLRELAQRELDALAARLNETVTLETLAGRDAVVLAEATGAHMIGALPGLGASWPAHATSAGKVLLAALEPARREEALRGKLKTLTPRTLATKKTLVAELERVARRGWAMSFEELEPGYVSVSVPVLDANDKTIAALTAGGPRHRLPRARLESLAAVLSRSAALLRIELGG